MSRTRRCAPSVESELFWLHVAPARNGGFVATIAVEAPPGPEHNLPILVTGEGMTAARAMGAAEAAAWKVIRPADEPAQPKAKRQSRQVGLPGVEG